MDNRPLYELKIRATFVLRLPEPVRAEFVEIARAKSPSASFDLAQFAARARGIVSTEVIAIAKATRWLSVIRCDHGDQVFEQIVA